MSSSHICRYRDDDRSWLGRIRAFWFIPTHFIASSTIACSLMYLIDGRNFLVHGRPDSGKIDTVRTSNLYQSDVTTLLSLALVVIRSIGGAWLTLFGWRMCFCILELEGASLGQMTRMIDHRLPPTRFLQRQAHSIKSLFLIPLMWLVFICGTPSQFITPLLTGAINWIPSVEYIEPMDILSITTPGPGFRWNLLNDFENNRFYDVISASSLASLASADNFNRSLSPTYRRHVPSLLGVPINTTVSNITVPFFRVESLEWITSLDESGDDLDSPREVIKDRSNPYLNFSNMNFGTGLNPFAYGTDVGRLTLVNTAPWRPAPVDNQSMRVYPTPETQQASTWVIVATQYADNCTADQSGSNAKFGDISAVAHYNPRPEDVHGCFALARINYTAGVIDCQGCRVVLNGVVESWPSSNQAQSDAPLPDPLVQTAIAMMPEVLFYMEIGNASSAPTWNNLDGYTRGMLSVAFQVSWNQLATDFQGQPMSQTKYMSPFPILKASVTKWRVLVWYAVNLLLTVSGMIMGLVESWCRFKTIRDPTLATLLLDTSAIIDHDDSGLCNAISLEGADGTRRVRLVVPSGSQIPYKHPYLEVGNRKLVEERKKGKYFRISGSEKY